MKEINCENVMMMKMAEIDGEATEVSADQINLHITACENCCREFEQLKNTDNLFKRQARHEQNADLWPALEKQIVGESASRISWKPFVLLAVLLVSYKLLEMVPEHDFGLAFKLVPLVFIIALFIFLKENPFKINAELEPER